jgi:hypothetical protein
MAETNPNSASDHSNAFSCGMGYTIYMRELDKHLPDSSIINISI